jgi:hypothetical protein
MKNNALQQFGQAFYDVFAAKTAICISISHRFFANIRSPGVMSAECRLNVAKSAAVLPDAAAVTDHPHPELRCIPL